MAENLNVNELFTLHLNGIKIIMQKYFVCILYLSAIFCLGRNSILSASHMDYLGGLRPGLMLELQLMR
jgi:hypothetical protein